MKAIQLDLGQELRGGQRQVFYLARYLLRNGPYQPVVVAPIGSPLLALAKAEGIETAGLPSGQEWRPGNFKILTNLLKSGSCQHILNTHCARSAALGAALRMFLGTRFHLVHTRRVSYPLTSWWSLRKYSLADYVVAVSAEIKQGLVASGLSDDTTFVIHSGIDSSLYFKREPRKVDRKIIGFIGALTQQKGCAVFIQALQILQNRCGQMWEAVIVGDGPLRPQLERLSCELGLATKIRFMGYRDSRDVLPMFDILSVPSVEGEGSSGVIKEAWVVGVPVVVSDLASFFELVQEGRSGLVSAKADPIALAEVLNTLLVDDYLCDRLVESGSERVKKFTDQAMGERYLNKYRSFFPSNADQ